MQKQRTLAGRSLAPILVASALAAAALTASAQSLGPASGYNYFVFGDVTLSNTDAEGRVAIGGDARFTNYGVASSLPSGSGGYSLVAGGDLTYQNGQVFQGSVIYGDTLSSSGFNVPNGSIVQGGYIDFDAAQAELTALSRTLSGFGATGTTTNYYGNLSFNGSDPSVNVFYLAGSTLDAANNFQVYAPAGSTVIINIGGTSITWDNMSVGLNSVDSYHVLYNFYEAESLTISGIGINGSILAPNAGVVFNNGQFNGTLVAGSLNGTGEFHNVLFQGTLPVPEPTSTTLIAVTGATLLLRRRR